MADAVIGVVIQNVSSFLQKEFSLFLGVNEDVEKMSSTLTAVQAVLEDAEEKQTTNRAIKDWLRKLKDAAYVLDDILDECSIKFTSADGDDDSGSANKEHCMSLCSINPKTMLFGYEVAKRLKEISKRLDEIAQEKQKFQLQERTIERQVEVPEWRQTSSIITQSVVYGRDEDREKIVDLLLWEASDCDGLSIYSIVGIGGLGKTTLAQAVFNDERVRKHFDLKIWICVSDDFSLNRVLQSIIESSTGEHSNVTNLDSLQKRVQELLQSKKYLVVLDDVWNENQEKWNRLKSVLNCGSKGASILITTRLRTVTNIMETRSVHHLLVLSEDDNWSLFKQCAFGSQKEEHPEIAAIGKEIVRRCGGLPLAAKTLGSLMRFKSGEKEWLDVKDSELWDLPQEENSVLPALRLSYFHLPLDLRRCFSFCAIFPKDTTIEKDTLIRLWMANGFVSSRNNLDMEDVGNMVCNELYHRSFLQDIREDQYGNIESFKIHDVLHDLALSVSGKDQCFISEKAELSKLSRSAHHIGYLNYSDESYLFSEFKLLRLHKIERLRTFIQFHSGSTLSCGSSSTYSLRALRTSAYHLSSLSHLLHLRYLDLDCYYISFLPDSICTLQKLQTLKLENCVDLCRLPNRLACLQDLRHLVIEDCFMLFAMPPNIGKLTLLKTLSVFIVGSKPGHSLAELRDLQLGGKLEIKGLENVQSGSDAEQANLVGKENLHSLCLSWGRDSKSIGDDEPVLEALRPHSHLSHLGIKGYRGLQLPSWLRDTSIIMSLVSLELHNFKNCQQLPPLGKLLHLKSLSIRGMKLVRYIDDGLHDYEAEKALRSLESLTLDELPNLERILKDEGAEMLPCLKELIISKVDKLTLPCLPSVEVLQVTECSERLLKSISNYQSLRYLRLQDNKEMTFFPEGIMRNMCHLKTLSIVGFNQLKALPTDLNGLVSLEELQIYSCEELESFPEHMLQALSSLITLQILGCEKLRSLGVVGHLTSLQRLALESCPNCILPTVVECFPYLQSLELNHFYDLESLPESLGDLTCLQELEILLCRKLRSLPSNFQRLQNLQKLMISYCPKLENRCKKGTGEDWHKIAHVPHIKCERRPTYWDRIKLEWKQRSSRREFVRHLVI